MRRFAFAAKLRRVGVLRFVARRGFVFVVSIKPRRQLPRDLLFDFVKRRAVVHIVPSAEAINNQLASDAGVLPTMPRRAIAQDTRHRRGLRLYCDFVHAPSLSFFNFR